MQILSGKIKLAKFAGLYKVVVQNTGLRVLDFQVTSRANPFIFQVALRIAAASFLLDLGLDKTIAKTVERFSGAANDGVVVLAAARKLGRDAAKFLPHRPGLLAVAVKERTTIFRRNTQVLFQMAVDDLPAQRGAFHYVETTESFRIVRKFRR